MLTRLPPDQGLAIVRQLGVRGKKVRLTYAFTSNADGSEKLPPLIIGKAQKPHAFKNKTGTQLGFDYRTNAKAWMTMKIYQEWLLEWNRMLKAKGRHILLLQDNFSGHVPPSEGLTNICVKNFAPNLTAHIQPMDQGIIKSFKAHYQARYIQHSIDKYEAGVTPSNIYDIDQLDAMWLASSAWQEVDTTTIQHCWDKAGILPDMQHTTSLTQPTLPISSLLHPLEDPISAAENEVVLLLDELEKTGALQHSNWMSISELLNPPFEAHEMNTVTDKDIFDAVMEARREREVGSCDNVDDDAATDIEPVPTHMEVLQMTLMLTCFTKDKNDEFIREFESILTSFRKWTRADSMKNMVDTKLTSYFTWTYNSFIAFVIAAIHVTNLSLLPITYSLITHSVWPIPKGMGYEGVDGSSISFWLNTDPCLCDLYTLSYLSMKGVVRGYVLLRNRRLMEFEEAVKTATLGQMKCLKYKKKSAQTKLHRDMHIHSPHLHRQWALWCGQSDLHL